MPGFVAERCRWQMQRGEDGTARGVAKQLQVRLYTIGNLVGIIIAFVL